MTVQSVAITEWNITHGSCGLLMKDRQSSMNAQIAGTPIAQMMFIVLH